MAMPPAVRKAVLSAHLTVSVGWIGAVIAYIALGIRAVTADDAETVRAVWIGMDVTGWYVIVPFALASLLTGVIVSLGTRWGLFRHYWVLYSFVLTVLATVVLLLHMPDVSELADVARAGAAGPRSAHLLGQLEEGDLLHPSLGLVVLLTVLVMNVYKPAGLTRYGRRSRTSDLPPRDAPT
jgi:hypothetical protein